MGVGGRKTLAVFLYYAFAFINNTRSPARPAPATMNRLDGSGVTIRLELHGVTEDSFPLASSVNAMKIVPIGSLGSEMYSPLKSHEPSEMSVTLKLNAEIPVPEPDSWLMALFRFGYVQFLPQSTGGASSDHKVVLLSFQFPDLSVKGVRTARNSCCPISPGCPPLNVALVVPEEIAITLPVLQSEPTAQR